MASRVGDAKLLTPLGLASPDYDERKIYCTVTVTVPVFVMGPELPVTVMM
jgi:hypothetical protein